MIFDSGRFLCQNSTPSLALLRLLNLTPYTLDAKDPRRKFLSAQRHPSNMDVIPLPNIYIGK